MMRCDDESIPYWSRPGLQTIICTPGTCENFAIAEHRENKIRKRGGRRVKRQRELWKGRRTLIRVGNLNIGTMTGRARECADKMERRNVNVVCVRETKWKGNKARNTGGSCKLLYNRAHGKRNGMGIVMGEELVEGVLEVKWVSDRLMVLKLEVKGSILNTVSAYAPQVNNSL